MRARRLGTPCDGPDQIAVALFTDLLLLSYCKIEVLPEIWSFP